MKCLNKILSLFLSLIIFAAGSTFVFAADNGDALAQKKAFTNISQEELQMNSLEENSKDKITLFSDGKTDFDIVIPDACSKSLNEAAETLKDVLKEMTGGSITVIGESKANASKSNICIDTVFNTERPNDDTIADGYHMVISDAGISICGATEAGTRNGIYSFIEDKLGCMFLTPDDTYIPSHKSIYLAKTNEIKKPASNWRDVYAYETVQNKWAAKLKLNGINIESDNSELTIEQLQYEGWGTWCHNCYQYLSPDDYFDEHPEYFSEKDGQRVTTYGDRDAYLCLSNPEVFEIVKNSLAQKIEENPTQMYWDFSGNDNPALAGCECEKCKAADTAAGGTGMGTLLPFLNKLAEAFPDKYISTLAYLHTLKAPVNIKAEPNVVIKLCAMPGDQASSYLNGANTNSAEFKQQVEEWSKITDKIVVWDYVVNFAHLLVPFPNFAVQAENQKFYEDNNVIGIFHQASREQGGEFACLRAYVLSRLMWEGSDMNVAECVSKYITAYFGNAAPKIIEYMNLCSQSLSQLDSALGLYDGLLAHYNGYLSQEKIFQYMDLINEAKDIIKGDPVLESRVEEVEISVTYAKTLLPKISDEERQEALEKLNSLCEKHSITMVCEWDSLESFNNASLNDIIKSEKKELNKPLTNALKITVGAVAGIACAAAAIILVKHIKKGKLKNESLI
ncbi:MAG: DUF4838 domain-containing protein [Eubacterium sp.]